MLKTKSSVFFRRLKLYAIGVGLGLVLTYGFFHDRYPTWLPGSRVLEEINRTEVSYSQKAICLMKCGNISEEGVREILKDGDVDFSASETRAKPCPSYIIEGETKEGQSLRVIIVKCDSTTTVLEASDFGRKYECSCD